MTSRRVLVTGASSGIGAATAQRLVREGWYVIAAARRIDRLKQLVETVQLEESVQADIAAGNVNTAAQSEGLPGDGGQPCPAGAGSIEAFQLDITSDDDVAALVAHCQRTGGLDALVNNAGGALGLDRVEDAVIDEWQRMYDINVLGTLRVTKALLPMLRESAQATGNSDIVVVTSVAALNTYEGGAGYTAAKHAERMLATTLRWEITGEPLRVIQIAPGAVATEEFSLNRFHGDAAKANATYEGFEPLQAQDIAEAVAWALSLPAHVAIDELAIRPRAQASSGKIVRTTDQR